MNYAVIHIEKGHKSAKALGAHCDRNGREVKNADPKRSQYNAKVIDGKMAKLGEGKPLETLISERIEAGYKGKKEIRKDAVKHLSIVLSGSHEKMEEINKDGTKLNNWIRANYDYISDTFGKENIVGFYLHRDEKTLHIHAQVVPITPDGRLCAKDFIGSPEKLRNIQTSYASKMQSVDNEFIRGVKGSKAKHTDVDWFYGKIKEFENLNQIYIPETRFLPTLKPLESIESNLLGHYTKKDFEGLKTAHFNEIESLKNQAQEKIDLVRNFGLKAEEGFRVLKFLKEKEKSKGVLKNREKGLDRGVER